MSRPAQTNRLRLTGSGHGHGYRRSALVDKEELFAAGLFRGLQGVSSASYVRFYLSGAAFPGVITTAPRQWRIDWLVYPST